MVPLLSAKFSKIQSLPHNFAGHFLIHTFSCSQNTIFAANSASHFGQFQIFRRFSGQFTPPMKVHPAPRKRNITLRYDVASLLAQANSCRQKKLRRLPHIFAKVLELPFHSDADVSIDETPESIRFTAATADISGDVRADAVAIYPGVTKVVIRGNGVVDLSGTDFELDLWRFRLPGSTRPELVSAAYEDGELVVTVPKGAAAAEDDEEEGSGGGDMRNGSRLILVQ